MGGKEARWRPPQASEKDLEECRRLGMEEVLLLCKKEVLFPGRFLVGSAAEGIHPISTVLTGAF
jgi:hypothetical protein